MVSCQDPLDRSISAEQAQKIITDTVLPISAYQVLSLRQSLGHVVAKPIVSPINVPAHRNSAMDGYALFSTDIPDKNTRRLKIVGTAYAGTPYPGTPAPGECVRIMTGAKMPAGTDTVIMQERVEVAADSILIDSNNRPGQNIREAGEDISLGSVVLDAGERLGPAQLGLVASLGIGEIPVLRRVRVAYFSSGDEIRSIGESLGEGEIFDSNRYTLHGLLTQAGAEVIDMGVIPDRSEEICNALTVAAENADLILTSGGVSVGEADYIAGALNRLGNIKFSKVAIKPGRPLTFGTIGTTHFFGLPGNPVAVMITFMQFVLPAIKRLAGEAYQPIPAFKVPCLSPLRKSPGRTEYQRGILEMDQDRGLVVRTTGRQGSGVLSSMSRGNCIILLRDSSQDITPGELVEVQPFSMLWNL